MAHETVEQHSEPAVAEKSCGCAGGHDCGCESCRAKNNKGTWVYALGTIAPRFPTVSVERELAQAIGRSDAKGLTDRQAFQAALARPENRYLVRQLCWVFSVDRVETYILTPRDPADFSLLVEALRPNPSPGDLNAVIGVKGPTSPPQACNGLQVPILAFDQLYSFDRDSLVRSIPRPEKTSAKEFGPVAEEVLDRILQVTGNTGDRDEDRALNYLAVRDPGVYAKAAEQFARNCSLTSVSVRPSALGGMRRIVEVIFGYTNRSTDVMEKFCVRVDVTEEFPFLQSKLSPCFDY
jgi:PatG C-terminal